MTSLIDSEILVPTSGNERAPQAKREHQQFLIGAGLAMALVAIGFGRGFLPGATPQPRSRQAIVLLHGGVFACWIVLFAGQASLIATHRRRLHRRLGMAGAVLAALMLVLGLAVAVHAARTGFAPIPGVDALRFLIVPIGDIIVFATLVGAGLYYRRTPDVHKRLMWLATMDLLFAPITRLPGVPGRPLLIGGFFLAVLAYAPLYERVAYGRSHRVSFWGSIAVFLSIPARDALATTQAWNAFASWLMR